MRRTILLLSVAAMLATMLAVAGPSLAKITDQTKVLYTDSNFGNGYQVGGTQDLENGTGTGTFKMFADGELPQSLLRSTIQYKGFPRAGGTTEITGGTWTLCAYPDPNPDDAYPDFPSDPNNTTVLLQPTTKCPDPAVRWGSLTGKWIDGTVKWDDSGKLVPVCTAPERSVYTGKAAVKGVLEVTDGTVDNKPVTGGSGKVEGTLDHTPLEHCGPPILTGTVELKLKF